MSYLEEIAIIHNVRHKYINEGTNIAIENIMKMIEETRSYKFGVCDADFVLDVLSAKIKEIGMD